MTGEPVDLDDRRSAAGKIATEIRRHSLEEFESDRQACRRRQEEIETQLFAEPSETWPVAAAKAQYLLRLYAATAEAQDARRKRLIEGALFDLARLTDRYKEET